MVGPLVWADGEATPVALEQSPPRGRVADSYRLHNPHTSPVVQAVLTWGFGCAFMTHSPNVMGLPIRPGDTSGAGNGGRARRRHSLVRGIQRW